MTKTVLVIGGDGYAGSRLCQILSQKEYHVNSVDIGWFNQNAGTQSIDYRLLTSDDLARYDYVVLLAGHSSVKSCGGPLISPWLNNVANFANLINKLRVDQTLIYASSSSVYGNSLPGVVFKEEDLSFTPINNYDITKYILDLHAENAILRGRSVIGLRFGTVNGWSPHTRSDLMINSMYCSARSSKRVVTTNEHIGRAILGVNDLSRAISACIENPVSGIYNLSSFNITVKEVAKAVSNYMQVPVENHGNLPEVYDFGLNCEKFNSTFNFAPVDTPISLIQELAEKFNDTLFTRRDDYIRYEPNEK